MDLRVPQVWTARRQAGGRAGGQPRAGRSRVRLACRFCVPLCWVVLAVACDRSRHSVEHVEVTGQVLYKGKPLPGGEVTFVTVKDAFASTGIIDERGNYKISAPVGEVKIGVDNQMLNPQASGAKQPNASRGAGRPDAGAPTPMKGTFVRIPPKYKDPEQSGLTYTVTKDETTHKIELTD